MLKELATTAELSTADFIKKTVGNLLFTYYAYLDHFHLRPADAEDLVDGLLFIEAKSYLDKKSIAQNVTAR